MSSIQLCPITRYSFGRFKGGLQSQAVNCYCQMQKWVTVRIKYRYVQHHYRYVILLSCHNQILLTTQIPLPFPKIFLTFSRIPWHFQFSRNSRRVVTPNVTFTTSFATDNAAMNSQQQVTLTWRWPRTRIQPLHQRREQPLHRTAQWQYEPQWLHHQLHTHTHTHTHTHMSDDLDVVIDSHLTMSAQVSSVRRSAFYQLHPLRPVVRSLTTDAAKMAFVSQRLDYCKSLFYSISDHLIRRLQAVQTAASRLVTGTRRRDHISPVLRQLHWLPVHQRIKFKMAIFV